MDVDHDVVHTLDHMHNSSIHNEKIFHLLAFDCPHIVIDPMCRKVGNPN